MERPLPLRQCADGSNAEGTGHQAEPAVLRLHDAMRMATFTHRLPALASFGSGGMRRVEEGWEAALAAVEPPELRGHLRLHCLEPFWSRDAGACYLGANEWPTGTSALDGRRKLLAGWEFGESQSGVAVVA